MSTNPTLVAISAVLAVGLFGCSSASPELAASTGVSADCMNLFEAPSPVEPIALLPGETPPLRVVLVDDPTASSGISGLDDTAVTAVTAAAKTAGTISVLAIGAADSPPNWLGNSYHLNEPTLARDTAKFARIAAAAPLCVGALVDTAVPKGEGSDVLGAMQLAGQELDGPGAIVISTDGLANSGVLDLSVQTYPAPVEEIVAALGSLGQLPDLTDADVTISGLGQVNGAALNPKILEWLVDLYTQLCTASNAKSCTVVSGVATGIEPAAGLPADPAVPFPAVEAPTVRGKACVFTIDSAVMFGGNSSVLGAGADAALGELKDDLGGAVVDIRVVGHTATFGDPDFNQNLSRDRANATVSRMLELGFDGSRLTADGVGGTAPRATPDHDGSTVIESNAALNRRVEFEVSGLPVCG